MRTNFLGLAGYQLVGGIYSNKSFASLDQNLRFIIESGSIEKRNNSWAFYYNFDQYLYEPIKGSGRGNRLQRIDPRHRQGQHRHAAVLGLRLQLIF